MYFRRFLLGGLIASSTGIYAAEFNGQLVNHAQKPIINAQILVRGESLQTRSDEQGNFTLDLPEGEYTLDIKAGSQGHFHQTIRISDDQQRVIVHIDENHDKKIVITANPLEHTRLDMATPAVVLSGDELVLKRSANLGEMLQLQPGMSVSSFGPAVSRPVIRGLSGARVLMTVNQMTLQDASTTSADHDVSVEPLLADQIEVLKGPATLLYGSGAIGGVVNVTDKKINPQGSTGLTGGAELRLGDSTTEERSMVATLNGGNAGFAWHLDAFSTEYSDAKIPGHAESKYLLEAEGHSEEEEEHEGTLENSASDSNGGSLGTTWNDDWGYFGLSVNRINKTYGVPGHAEHDEDPVPAPAPGEEHEEGVAIDLEQTRFDIQSELYQPFQSIDRWFFGASHTDYQHVELEGEEIGTLFENKASEFRSYVTHKPADGWEGIIGAQYSNRDFSALGDEAFVPPSKTQVSSLFWVEEKSFDQLKIELGIRAESQRTQVEGFETRTKTGVSFSSGFVYTLSSGDKLAVNFAHAERHPSVEEGYSFGEHAATQTFEIGDPNLRKETSNNLDVSYRFETEHLTGEINGYWNQFDGFIYGAYEDNIGAVLDLHGQIVFIDPDLPVVHYTQQDAAIKGVEIQVKTPLISEQGYGLNLGVVADFIEAELDSGAYLPRIPPLKYGLTLSYDYDALLADLSWIHYDDQRKTSNNELPTDGFNLLELELAYRMTSADSDILWFLRGKNLLDEEARDHSSFLKDLAPRAGRSWTAGIRYQF